jgi:hypothetical protein
MSTTTDDLENLEARADAHLAAEAGHVEDDLDAAARAADGDGGDVDPGDERSPVRLAIAVAFPVIAAAVMVGGVFTGVGARFYAGAAGLLGIGLALLAHRIRKPAASNAVIVVGLFAIGLLMVVPSGLENVASTRSLAAAAASAGDVLRPPVPLTAGWQAIIGWLMGILGFTAAWLAIVVHRPALSLLLPLPVAAIAGISVPKNAQVGSGMAVLALFAVGLALLASAQAVGEDDERLPVAYEVRKALRALPLIAIITVGLYFLAQADFLFPKPYIDPTQEPQKPKRVPLSEVEDRVLFEVESSISGPWRIGSLDVYDGKDWRLPPFAENKLDDVPRSGIVDEELQAGVKATFTVAGLGGAILPGLPNPVGIIAEGPRLAFDERNSNIRVSQGQVQAGLKYTVTAAALPSIDDLKQITDPIPGDIRRFARIGDPPPAVSSLIDQAPRGSAWETFDYLRTYVLDNVTATGVGAPVSVTPERVQDMLAGTREASPYEIVAAQAMLARWVGIPSRIGYGFDGGDEIDGKLQVRPRNGATFVEVYFPGYKWLPVIGTPKKAKPTVGNDAGQQQFDPTVLPSNDIGVRVFLPLVVQPESPFLDNVRTAVLIIVPTILVLVLLYVLFPGIAKLIKRSRRRSAAQAAGPRARLALAYAEWRDLAADFGYRYPTDTPLMFLDRFVEDQEHVELAWLVTRALWGDLQDDLTPEVAAHAEELSRALSRRLAQAQPATLRVVARLSRVSLRDPYAPETDLTRKDKDRVPAMA